MSPVTGEQLRTLYEAEKARIMAVEEYARDYEWVDQRTWSTVKDLGAENFLLEHAYVVLCSGFKNSTVEGFWQRYVDAWARWTCWEEMDVEVAVKVCNTFFRNKAKNKAIGDACLRMQKVGWWNVVADISFMGVDSLRAWPWIGDITKFHLARNLGMDVVKPDRHLVRWADHLGYETPLALCEEIHRLTGERIGTVDLVLWRSAEAFGPPKGGVADDV